ncbi:MAG: hypothetical protein IJD64_00185, partial [Clostridia bacterium]|nr:hypothetical protein [Clostridia bacterium]
PALIGAILREGEPLPYGVEYYLVVGEAFRLPFLRLRFLCFLREEQAPPLPQNMRKFQRNSVAVNITTTLSSLWDIELTWRSFL